MSDTLIAFVDDLTAIVKERNELRAERDLLNDQLSQLLETYGVPRRVLLGANNGIKGADRPNRKKLEPHEVAQIHQYYRNGLAVTELARMYDVHHATISRILSGVYHKDAA